MNQQKKNTDYYSRVREWPSVLDIEKEKKFLDIGCGKGTLGQYLKEEFGAHVTGIEMMKKMAQDAVLILDEVICSRIEDLDFTAYNEKFDYIVFSDSLEHFIDPEFVLIQSKAMLKTDGELLISIPNVRNFRVILPLLFFGDFEYQEEGLLDRTHLRFFTLSSISNALKRTGYNIKKIEMDLPINTKTGLLNRITFGLFREILTSHYFIKASK